MMLGNDALALPCYHVYMIHVRQVGRPRTRIGHDRLGYCHVLIIRRHAAECILRRQCPDPTTKRAAHRPMQLNVRPSTCRTTTTSREHACLDIGHFAKLDINNTHRLTKR